MPKLKPKGIGYRRRFAEGGGYSESERADRDAALGIDSYGRDEGVRAEAAANAQSSDGSRAGGFGDNSRDGSQTQMGTDQALGYDTRDVKAQYDVAQGINKSWLDPRTADVRFNPVNGQYEVATYFDPNPLNAQTALGSLGRTMVGGLTGLAAGAGARAAGLDTRFQLSGPGSLARGIGATSMPGEAGADSAGGTDVELRTVDDRKADEAQAPAPTQQASRIQFTPYTGDPTRYGQGPGHRFWQEVPVKAAAGQPVRGIGGGQDDEIPALLSDGEYVLDATTVADIGDGSTEEGFRRLDAFRKEVRKHKGRKAETIPPKAKGIGQYMRGAD